MISETMESAAATPFVVYDSVVSTILCFFNVLILSYSTTTHMMSACHTYYFQSQENDLYQSYSRRQIENQNPAFDLLMTEMNGICGQRNGQLKELRSTNPLSRCFFPFLSVKAMHMCRSIFWQIQWRMWLIDKIVISTYDKKMSNVLHALAMLWH